MKSALISLLDSKHAVNIKKACCVSKAEDCCLVMIDSVVTLSDSRRDSLHTATTLVLILIIVSLDLAYCLWYSVDTGPRFVLFALIRCWWLAVLSLSFFLSLLKLRIAVLFGEEQQKYKRTV